MTQRRAKRFILICISLFHFRVQRRIITLVNFLVFKETYSDPENGTYDSYGIRAVEELRIPDISCNRGEVEQFARELEEPQAQLAHFEDLVEDFLLR